MRTQFLIFFIFLTRLVSAQDVTIQSIELTAEQVVLHYDLIDTTKNRTYTIFLYSSKDNYLAPLGKVSGDVGIEVKPGMNKRIAWSAREELGTSFVGDVDLEIRGRVYIPFIRFDSFDQVKVRKRGVPFLVKWAGGTRQNILNFELMRGEKLVYTFPNVPNAFEYKLTIPKNTKPGNGYSLRVSDTRNKDQVVTTSTFTIKSRIPLLVKAVPILALGGLVYVIATKPSGSSDKPDPPPPPNSSN